MPDWLDKAKEAANKAAEEAKKLAEAAKNANYSEMLNKTKDLATHAADEAKKAADNIMKKDTPPTAPNIVPPPDNPPGAQPESPSHIVLDKIAQVEQLLQEIKLLLQ